MSPVVLNIHPPVAETAALLSGRPNCAGTRKPCQVLVSQAGRGPFSNRLASRIGLEQHSR